MRDDSQREDEMWVWGGVWVLILLILLVFAWWFLPWWLAGLLTLGVLVWELQ